MKRIQRLLYPQQSRPSPLTVAPLTVIALGILAVWQSAAAQTTPKNDPYTLWVNEDVAYIILPVEKAEFLALKTNPERERFIEEFWKLRDPTPGTPENEFKEQHYRRIAYSNSRFKAPGIPGWKTDRGRTYIVYGPPDEMESHPAVRSEQWLYKYIERVGTRVVFGFVDTTSNGNYVLKEDPAKQR